GAPRPAGFSPPIGIRQRAGPPAEAGSGEPSLVVAPVWSGEASAHRGTAERRERLRWLSPWRQVAQYVGGDTGDGRDGALECLVCRSRGVGDAADFADVLTGGGFDLFRRGGRAAARRRG